MVLIAVCGKPNVGKSTFLAACTGTSPQIANYPFTTIDPNKGVAFVRATCPHVRLGVKCDPNNARCENGIRLVPVNMVDVAGIVPGAHEGKGMGNRFLTDVANADVLTIFADASGSTDDGGNIVSEGSHSPVRDIQLFLDELDEWFYDVVKRNADKSKGNTGLNDFFTSLTGIGVPLAVAKDLWERMALPKEPPKWRDADYHAYSKTLREKTKPFLIAANKSESKAATEGIEALAEEFPGVPVIRMCADYELALTKARAVGMVEYDGKKITLTEKGSANPRAAEAIGRIAAYVSANGSTGVADAVDTAVYKLAGYMVAYPVEDENHFSNHFGKILPDAILLKKGSTPLDLAGAIHADLAKHFLHAVDAEKKTRMGKEHPLEDGAVVKIVSAK